MRNGNAGVRSKFSIRRRDNHALGVTLGRYIIVRECAEGEIHMVGLFINESVISAYQFK